MPFVLAGLIVILVVLIILGGLESKPENDNAASKAFVYEGFYHNVKIISLFSHKPVFFPFLFKNS